MGTQCSLRYVKEYGTKKTQLLYKVYTKVTETSVIFKGLCLKRAVSNQTKKVTIRKNLILPPKKRLSDSDIMLPARRGHGPPIS